MLMEIVSEWITISPSKKSPSSVLQSIFPVQFLNGKSGTHEQIQGLHSQVSPLKSYKRFTSPKPV